MLDRTVVSYCVHCCRAYLVTLRADKAPHHHSWRPLTIVCHNCNATLKECMYNKREIRGGQKNLPLSITELCDRCNHRFKCYTEREPVRVGDSWSDMLLGFYPVRVMNSLIEIENVRR